VLRPETVPGDPVLLAWTDTRRRHGIPQRYVEQLLDGVAQDLQPRPLQTFDDLAAYAYGVASTVGLMSMHIIGYAGAEAVPHAIKLGVALQVTNILRDVGEDWRAGRLYLPLAELEHFGLAPAAVGAATLDDRWRAFMRFQIDRNRRLYAEAWPGIRLLHRDGRLAVMAAADLYRGILDDIEAHDYDVFHRRAHLGGWAKLKRLPRLWRESRR
jgi:phytoene synthase